MDNQEGTVYLLGKAKMPFLSPKYDPLKLVLCPCFTGLELVMKEISFYKNVQHLFVFIEVR